ncbi:MAG: TonB-dependent receptor [Pseudomonadota bacterium]
MSKRLSFAHLLSSAASVGALAFGAAYAQENDDETDEIIVTATKREQSIQDVPFSINAQTQEDLQRTGSQTLEDISRNVAGLTIQNLGPGQSQVAIRGVSAGQIVRDQPGVKEQVGVYLDESVISLSLFTPDLDLFDLARVETLRGPQGTLFGSESIGGTIRYITQQPKIGEFEALFEGNYNVIDGGGMGGHAKGVLNLPLTENASIRLVGFHTEYGGFIDALSDDAGAPNGIAVTDDVNDGTRSGGRVALRWEVNERFTTTPRVIFQRIGTDGFNRQESFNLFANPFTTQRTAVNFGERQQFLRLGEEFEDDVLIFDNTAEFDFEFATLTSVTSYTDRSILVSRDASALTGSVSVDLGFADAAVLLPSNLRDTTELNQFTQELRLAGSYERFDWLIGAFYSDTERDYAQRLPTPGYDAATDAALGAGTAAGVQNGFPVDSPFNSDLSFDLEQFAFFGEATLALTDRLDFTAGVRYYNFEETRTILQGGLFSSLADQTDETDSDGFTPRFLLSYDISDDVTVNAQVSRGFRLGGVNDPLNVPLCTADDEAIFGGFQDFGDETLWNYEGGVKVNKGVFRFNAAAFYSDISDLQVTLDAGSCSSRISFNVDARTLGGEWEIAAEPMPGLELSVAGSYVDSEFTESAVDGSGTVLAGVEDGNRLASVPEFQIAATGTYSFPVGSNEGYVAASVQHVGSRFTQPSDQVPGAGDFISGLAFGGASGMDVTSLDLELDPYQIVNLNAGINFETWELFAYINNVTDENALLSFDRERGGRARLGFRTNQPRTFGITGRWRF